MNTATIIANIVFGAIGFVAFVCGKKTASWRKMLLGIGLIGYSYFISSTMLIYGIGIALTIALFVWRE